MLRHNLLLIYRSFKKFKSTFFINLIGLSTGLACTLFIYLWVNDELTVNRFHEKDNQLFQVMLKNEVAGAIEVGTMMPPVLAEALIQEMPEVESAVTEVIKFSENTLSVEQQQFKARGAYAGEDYFNIFSYELVFGEKKQALADENNIVISEDLAKKLFKTRENILGRSITFDQNEQYLVSGVFKIPSNSSKQFDFLLPEKVVFKHYTNLKKDWTSNSMWETFLVLKEGTKVSDFNAKIQDLIKTKSNQENISLFVTPFADTYLYGKYENGIQTGGRIEYVKLFSITAIFILLIACINFMNLSTAKASGKIKEVGIKKAIGADRKTLIFQYLGESILMVSLSVILAIILVVLFLPHFNQITGKELFLPFNLNFIFICIGVILVTGVTAGSYPAMFLSGFSPAMVLKGKLNSGVGELLARKGLVIFQFTLSIIFIVAVMVVNSQLELIQNKNLGFNKNNIVYFEMDKEVKEHLEPFLSGVKKISGVHNASSIFRTFIGDQNSTSDISWEGKASDLIPLMQSRRVNYDIIELLNIQMKEGRSFSINFASDDSAIIFNKAAIDLIGIKDPVGMQVTLFGQNYQILGVTENFHFESLHETVKPMFFILSPERTNTIMLKIGSENIAGTIDKIQEYYKTFTQGLPLEYKFLDEEFQAQYVAEKRVATLSKYFAGLAILISCLGLFGLAAFTAERRLKEIGIRKVLGSSEFGIVRLLSRDFTKIVLTAIIIALPLSYFIAKNWLDNFAFKIDLEWWYFIGAGFIALMVAWLTVGTQAIKAARVNPVDCLKDE